MSFNFDGTINWCAMRPIDAIILIVVYAMIIRFGIMAGREMYTIIRGWFR